MEEVEVGFRRESQRADHMDPRLKQQENMSYDPKKEKKKKNTLYQQATEQRSRSSPVIISQQTLTDYIQLVGVINAAVRVFHHTGVVSPVGGYDRLHDDGPHVASDLKVKGNKRSFKKTACVLVSVWQTGEREDYWT